MVNSMTFILLIGIIAIIYSLYAASKKQNVTARNAFVIGIVIAGAAIFLGGASIADLGTLATVGAPDDNGGLEPDCEMAPVDNLTIMAKNSYTMADADEDVELYNLGADVKDPDVAELDKVDIGGGEGYGESGLFNFCDTAATKDLWFEGGSTYYNEKLSGWFISGNRMTGNGNLYMNYPDESAPLTYIRAVPVGTISDFDTNVGESSTACIQDNATDIAYYNETGAACTTSFYEEFQIGNSVANSELRDVVICIQDANAGTNANDGNEFSAIDVSYISGTNIDETGILSGDIISLWTDSAGSGGYICKPLASKIGANEQGTYRFTVTLSETNWAGGEHTKIWIDDLGGYTVYQYPDGDAKATASGFEWRNSV